uniref:Uncharacterized protein n=1 Tax=Clandestinovirus TaxID=2831644 RepID=A0A8F8PMP6_9VIRU|nr:hypothetical protein KOM_12_457 [Clandestinovirus]
MNRDSAKLAIGMNFLRCISEAIQFDIPSGFTMINNEASFLLYKATMRLLDRVIVTLAENNRWDEEAVRLASHKVLCPVNLAHSESIGCASDKLLLAQGKQLFDPETECGEYLLKLTNNRVSNEVADRGVSLSKEDINIVVNGLSKVAWAYVVAIARQARKSSKGTKLTEPLVKQVLAHNVIFIKDKTIPNLSTPNGDLEQKATEAMAEEQTLIANVTQEREKTAVSVNRNYRPPADDDIITNYTVNPKDAKAVDDYFADDSFIANYTVNRNEPELLSDSYANDSLANSVESMPERTDIYGNYTIADTEPRWDTERMANYTLNDSYDSEEEDFRPSTEMGGNYTMGGYDSEEDRGTDMYANYTLQKEREREERMFPNRRFKAAQAAGLLPLNDSYGSDDDGAVVRNVYIEGASPEVEDGDMQDAQSLLQQVGLTGPVNDENDDEEDIGEGNELLQEGEDEDDEQDDENENEDEEEDDEEDEAGGDYDTYETGGTFTDDTDFMPVSDLTVAPAITETVDKEQPSYNMSEHKQVFHDDDGLTVSSGCGCGPKGGPGARGGIEYYNW